MRGAVGISAEFVVAKVHRRRESLEGRDVEIFAGHVGCFEGWVVWMRV